MSSYTE